MRISVNNHKVKSTFLILILAFMIFVNLFALNYIIPYSRYSNNKLNSKKSNNFIQNSNSGFVESPITNPNSLYAENNTNAVLTCNKTQSFLGRTPHLIKINTYNWNFTATKLGFFGISQNYTLIVEDIAEDHNNIFQEDVYDEWAQGFSLNAQFSRINKIGLYLQYRGKYDLWVEVYNATDTGDLSLEPDKLLMKSETVTIENLFNAKSEFIIFNFQSNKIINNSETCDNTFFIILNGTKTGGIYAFVEWWYADDEKGIDNGDALEYKNNRWELNSIDYYSIINLTQLFFPEDINMKINDSATTTIDVLNGASPGRGHVSFSKFIPNSNVSILVTSTTFVNFMAISNTRLSNSSHALTQFYAGSQLPTVNINISLYAHFIIDSFAKKLNITLQKSWNVSLISASQLILSSSDWKRSGNYLLINASDNFYAIKCIDHNYIGNIILNTYKDSLFINHNLTVNNTFRIYNSITPINLTIYNSSDRLIHTQKKLPSNYYCSFDPYNMTSNGMFKIILKWFNGTSIGYNFSNIEVQYHADFYEISDNINQSKPFQAGELVLVDAFYNNTELNCGILNASSDISINMTSRTQYNVSEFGGGYYNITIYTNQLTSKNYTLVISAHKVGYEESNFSIRFQIITHFNATMNITGYYGNVFRNGSWWVHPNPYFSDNTHKIQIIYKNGTAPYDGIYPAAIYAYPNWSSDVWYGNPFDTFGRYDITLDTTGLHEGDKGEITIIATSNMFETKEIRIFFKIDEIPENLLSFDINGFEEITAYEGETIQIAASFIDDFHGKDIVFENDTEGNLTWYIPGTTATGLMSKIIHTYMDSIELPSYNITGGDYNITIKAQALRDYATKEVNISLHVLNKEPTNINITYYTESDVRIGKPLYIYSTLSFSNGTRLNYKMLEFNLTYLNNTIIIDSVNTTILTDSNGVATYFISELPDNINKIRVNCSYSGTEKIAETKGSRIINVLDKYVTFINITAEYYNDIRVGRNISFHANLTSLDFGPMIGTSVIFNITYLFYTGNSSLLVYKSFGTNENGTASYSIEHIPDGVKKIYISVKYLGTNTYHSCSDFKNYSVNKKFNTSLELISALPQEVMVGNYIFLEVKLTNTENGVPISKATINFKILFDNGYSLTQKSTTLTTGIAISNIKIPNEASNAQYFTVSIDYEGDYSIVNASFISHARINVLTPVRLFVRNLPFILTVVAIGVASVLTYQFTIRAPRIRRKIRRMREVNQKFSDILNVQHLMILYKETGITIYNHSFQERTFDPDLISGFLTAIASFQTGSHIKTGKDAITSGFELTYANFIILVEEGNYTRVGLILDQKPSSELRQSLRKFLNLFENKYEKELKQFSGYIKPFKNSGKLVEQVFEASLIWPHRVNPNITSEMEKNLTNFESMILTLALTIQKEKSFFMTPALIEAVLEVKKTKTEEILAAFDDLRKKNIFIPFPLEELAKIIEEDKEKSQIVDITTKLEDDEEIVPPIKGVPKKDMVYLNKHLKLTNYVFQKWFLNELSKTPLPEITNYIKKIINNWKKNKDEITSLMNKAKNSKEKGDLVSAVEIFDEAKKYAEEIGLEDKATEISNKIHETLEIMKNNVPLKYEKLINKFLNEINEINKKAEIEVNNKNFINVCILYIKAAHLSLQIGDSKTAQLYLDEIVKYEKNLEDL